MSLMSYLKKEEKKILNQLNISLAEELASL
jgi:hypothetical protein